VKGKVILLLLFLAAVAHSVFVPSDYYYENETPEVRVETWVVDGQTYKVYFLDDVPTFLVYNDTLITDPEEISRVVEAHYRATYPISEDLLQEIRELILRFNESRFDNDNPYKIEEERCRGLAGENAVRSIPPATLNRTLSNPYFNGDIYKFYAAILLSNGLVPEGYSEEYVADQLRYFFTNSDALSEAIAGAYRITYEIYPSPKVLSKATQLQQLVEEIERRARNIERSRILGINDPEICGEQGCLYLCPPPRYDYDALSSLQARVEELLTTVQAYSRWREVADAIARETEERIFYVFATTETERITHALAPLNATWAKAKEDIQELSRVVRDNALMEYYNAIEELFDSIEQDLEEKNFNNTQEKVANLTRMIDSAKARYVMLKDLYEETVNYKELASVLEKLIKDRGPVEETLMLKEELDRNFIPPFTYASLKRFNEKYKEVVDTLKAYYKQGGRKEDPLFGLKKFLAGAANGIYALIHALPAPVREALGTSLPLATTLLISLSTFFATLFFGTLAYVKLYQRVGRRKLLYFTLLTVVAFIAGGVSALVYLPTSHLASLNEILPFAEHIASAPNATLVVVLGSSYDEAIESCALSTKRELESLGVDVSLMEIRGSQCLWDGREDSSINCLTALRPPYIRYEPGPPSVSGSLVGEVHLVVRGNKETFERCELRHYLALINQLRGGGDE